MNNFDVHNWKWNQLIESTITEDSKVENLIDEIIDGISGYLADDVSKDDKFLRGTLRTIIGSQYMNENSSYDLESIANQLEAEHPDLRFDVNKPLNRIDVRGSQQDLINFGSDMQGETFGEYEVFATDDDDRGEIVRIIRSDSITRNEAKITEEKDRCHRKADQVYGTKTSAYKSGAIVKCRKGMIWKKK